MDWKKYLTEWRDSYRNDLVNNIMPFWLRNGLDRVNGGIYTCLDRDGSLIDGTKSVWFQGEMATHSSTLAWESVWTEEPGGLQSMGSQKSQT